MFIIDMGSGETSKNDIAYIRKMIDAIPPSPRKVVIKWQLFEDIPPLTPLDHDVYLYARDYADKKGYATGSSVFDEESLDFLLSTDPAFVKIACRPHLYPLLDKIPADVMTVVSVGRNEDYKMMLEAYPEVVVMCCVADYPARYESYGVFHDEYLRMGISDHTEDWKLYQDFEPLVYECHYRLPDSTGPDAMGFSRLPSQLEVVL